MADSMDVEDAERITDSLPGIGELKAFTQESFASIVQAIKSAGNLPAAGEDHDFYYSFSDFREFRTAQGARLLSNIGNLLRHWRVHCQWPSDTHGIEPDGDELLDSLVEANDIILEGVDNSLDEAAGLKKSTKVTNQTVTGAPGQQGTPVVCSWNRKKQNIPGSKDSNNFRFLMAKNIQRPQLRFKDKIDNSNTPFIPVIKRKPNALRPLEMVEQSASIQPESLLVPSVIADFVHQERMRGEGQNRSSVKSTAHPYHYELEVFEPSKTQMKPHKEQLYEVFDKTPYTFVDTPELLQELSEHLNTVTEFAVDLEAHSYRSFQGFCCLMQISTRNHDYLIDTLELRHELHILNDSFTNPNILKVLHGADMDIGWLQRDFGIYVVNMFDTGQAARVLNYGKYSLAFLLKKFCDVTANKQYQLADWRIRPLPDEMVRYAREDTHYLLYIYDRLHDELLKSGNANNNLLQSVYSRSKQICLKRYEKPLFTSESYRRVLEKHKRTFNNEQLCTFRLLFAWRDNIAREEDESYGFVLPNHTMFQIAETMPREAQGVLACCNPVPTLVKQYVNEIHMLIMQAKELALTTNKNSSATAILTQVDGGSSSKQNGLLHPSVPQSPLIDANIKPTQTYFPGESTVVTSASPSSFAEVIASGPAVIRAKPTVSLFEFPEDEQLTAGQKKAEKIKASFENPFKKFLPTKSQSETTEGMAVTMVTEEPQSQQQVDMINQQWREAIQTPMTAEPSVAKKRGLAGDTETEEDLTPLRKRTPGQSSAKRRKRESYEAGSSTSPSQNREVAAENSTFVPFKYSEADYSTFSSGIEKQTKDKPIVFDPYRSSHNSKQSKGQRSKVHMKSGQRNLTFSSNKRGNQKQNWPRR
ncbi:unnamed protein product [Porites lobata]|uniref:HRDC domain-containing protein n=1 Tax=Porites lobata TaxID=104759 RepID=A0ABN8MWS8_9CNID|nr:unnamed protein product [Porites lobata]